MSSMSWDQTASCPDYYKWEGPGAWKIILRKHESGRWTAELYGPDQGYGYPALKDRAIGSRKEAKTRTKSYLEGEHGGRR